MTDNSAIKLIWANADAVCFDVDSTVIQEEAIDELAKFCGKGEEVQRLTLGAMGGKMNFRDALQKRLGLIRPSMAQIREFVRTKPPQLTPGIKKLVDALHNRGTPIYLISGGFRSLIGPVAIELNIPLQNIYANKLKFYFNGDYGGFDESEPTSQNGGKGQVIRILKEKYGYESVVLIGDGMTDLEACPPADAFIGFGGNIVRHDVRKRCQWFIYDFQELIDVLNEHPK